RRNCSVKRLVVVPVVMMFLLAALVPAASADTPNVVFMGQGQSNALNLSVPLLNSLPTSILSGILGNLGALGKGITAGHTESTFEGLTNPSVNGLAIGLCGLLGQNLLSLPATGGTLPGTLPALGGLPNLGGLCSGQTQATSSSVGSHGSTTQTCADLNIAILDIKTACSQSYSTIDGGRPISQNNAGVAEINVALLPNVLGGLGLNSLLGTLGSGSSVVSNNGAATQETTQAAGAHIGLIADLIQIDVGAANSTVSWNDATGQASGDASPAIATIKIANPLGGAPLLNLPLSLPSLSGLLGGLGGLTQADQSGDLTLLAGTPLETTIKIASATPHQ